MSFDQMLAGMEDAWMESRDQRVRDPLTIADGIHLDIPFDQYIRINAINQSSLRNLWMSPRHYQYCPAREDSASFRIGSYVHAHKLEPETLANLYVVVPTDALEKQVQDERIAAGEVKYTAPRQTARYKALVQQFLAVHPGKTAISQEEFVQTGNMLKSLSNDKLCASLFANGIPEVTVVWTDPSTSLRCKARIDWWDLGGNRLVDLKTTEDACAWYIDKWGYHLQSQFYLHGAHVAWENSSAKIKKLIPNPAGVKRKKSQVFPALTQFWFVVVEKRQPFTVLAAPVSERAALAGQKELDVLLPLLRSCKDSSAWPGLAHPASWELSPFYAHDMDRQPLVMYGLDRESTRNANVLDAAELITRIYGDK
jgi:hypothetical protein